MSTNTRHQKKGIDLPTHAEYIGTDDQHRHHHYSAYENTIYVLKDGKRVHVRAFEDIAGLAQWVSQVAEHYGWSELQYSDGTTADFLTETLEEASQK